MKNRNKAIELLGEYAIDKRNKRCLSERRIKIMTDFIIKNKDRKIIVIKNNTSTCSPLLKGKIDAVKIGGVHGSYHLWAVAK